MKKLFTLLFTSFVLGAHAQTTIYTETFNSGSATNWTLNTTDMGGVPPTNNQWIINNAYAAGMSGFTTPNQPSGVTGAPNSYYMHIYPGPSIAPLYGSNSVFLSASSGETYFTAMTTPISTTGYTGVTLSFWWLCNGSSTAAGKVFYRTSASGTWTQFTAPVATYFGNSSWLQQTITLAALDNQAFLEFGFQFTDGTSGGSDPAFGVDEIKVTGTASAGPVPTASFTYSPNDTVCTDSCITFTSTSSGGTIDSVKWTMAPAVVMPNVTVNPLMVCFTASSAFTVTLTAYGGGSSTSASQAIYIKPKPAAPTITKSGHTLTVPTGSTSYQWYNGTTAISGATNNTYTYTGSGNFSVVVSNGSCKNTSSNSINTASIPQVSSGENAFWASRDQNGLTIWSKDLLKESIYVSIYDAAGRRIIQDQWSEGSDMKAFSDLSLVTGLYIIRLNDNTGNSVSLKYME